MGDSRLILHEPPILSTILQTFELVGRYILRQSDITFGLSVQGAVAVRSFKSVIS
jgi:hypothetical protein